MESSILNLQRNSGVKLLLVLFATGVLALFQRVDVFHMLQPQSTTDHPNMAFGVNRIIRLILNDFACFILIFVFFEKKHLKLVFGVTSGIINHPSFVFMGKIDSGGRC